MRVYAVVGVYGGVVEDVSVHQSPEGAQERSRKLREEYGIKEGEEEYSEHDVRVVPTELEE
jgi:hypothetical protein